MGYYVINFVSEAHTLQDDTTFDGNISPAGEIFVKAQYLRCLQEKTNWYWDQKISKKPSFSQHEILYIHVLMLWQ